MQQQRDRARRIVGESNRGVGPKQPISVPTASSVRSGRALPRELPGTHDPGDPERGAQPVSVAAVTVASARAPGESRSTSSAASPHISGSAPARAATEWNAGGHRLKARKPESLVAGGHHDDASTGVEPGEQLLSDVAEPANAGDVAAQIAPVRAGENEFDAAIRERASDRFER